MAARCSGRPFAIPRTATSGSPPVNGHCVYSPSHPKLVRERSRMSNHPEVSSPVAAAPGVPVDAGGTPDGGIATLPPFDERPLDHSPIDPRTGEPRRPFLIWLAAGLGLVSLVFVIGALGLVMWNSIEGFAEASWVNGRMETDPGSWVRVAFSVVNAVIGAAVGGATAFVGYHIFIGAEWTKWGALAATAVSAASLMLTPLAAISIVPIAISAILVWLPPCRRYFAAWTALRADRTPPLEVPERVYYGPLPRYR